MNTTTPAASAPPDHAELVRTENQGVASIIEFMLGTDEQAITLAVNSLLRDGWGLSSITSHSVTMSRMWRWPMDGESASETLPDQESSCARS